MRKDIEFKSKGDLCRGWFYVPEKVKEPFPVVVMAGGWCYVREIVMPIYADFFVRAGLGVIIFDYRNFGSSDGTPRQHINPYEQIEDYKNAICFAQTLPGVDPERIGIWGISYSGGHVLAVGATDPRVKCIVSIIPAVDGYENMKRPHGGMSFRKITETVLEDRKRRFEGENSDYIPMSAVDWEKTVCTFPFPEIYEFFTGIQKTSAPNHQHRSTIESVELFMTYNVFPYVRRILNTPTLMIISEGDDITPWDLQIDAFNQISTTKKKLFVMPKTSHMGLYSNRNKLEVAAEVATEWLVENLIKPYE